MKMKLQFILCLLLVAFSSACKKDNYAPPKSMLTGAILYEGDTIRVASMQVKFELWQTGFGKLTPINVNVNQDGTFSALLFDGDYKLDFPRGEGPFMSNKIDQKNNSDTLLVHVRGNTQQNIEVLPYYMIRNPKFSLNGRTVIATFKLEKIITDVNSKSIDNVYLYLNKTLFVDNNNNIASSSISGVDISDMNNISLQVNIPELIPDQNYIFARIGVKITDVEDMLFSKVIKISFQ